MKKNIFKLILAASLLPSLFMNVYGQDSVIIIRHGEKPADGSNLTCKGLNRALALPHVLGNLISVPYYTYVPAMDNTGKKTKHARMFETLIPYAAQHNLDINSHFDESDHKNIALNITANIGTKSKHGTILLVWEHKNIAGIALALGVPQSHVPEWDDNDFDSIWIITGIGDKKPVLSITREGLDGVSGTCP